MLKVSVGICAYNEERNIGKLLNALINQKAERVKIDEIIVVSSGSTDKTDDIVLDFAKIDDRIFLIKQKRREGKASAINEFLKNALREVCVLESADTIPLSFTIEKLCLPFYDRSVGMTGGHPIPMNDRSTLMGFIGHLVWELHHQISLERPKMGELVAFRNVIDEIPRDVVVDEAWIEAKMRRMGFRIIYVPDAICYNKAPENIRDYVRQRRRIHAGHLHLKRTLNYGVSTMDFGMILGKILKVVKPKDFIFALFAIFLEAFCILLGYYDYFRGKSHVIWEVARSTKIL